MNRYERTIRSSGNCDPERSQAMLRLWLKGATIQQIADSYGLSKQRVAQLLRLLPEYKPKWGRKRRQLRSARRGQ